MPHTSTPGASGGVSDDVWSPRATDPAPPPIALPGYRDLVLVASGGDSLVYRAVQDGVNRPVAVKVLVGEAEGVPAARYRRELEITVRLGHAHPNIVTVLDTQILPDGRPCIVMEYYELGSLQDQLRAHGPLPSSAVVAAGTVVADALAYAHREGVLHRDVKPQNILVLPTSYVLADFGLARRIDAGHTSSLERFSYRHASPQVLDGELPTVADDVYSLGSTLFTLLDGRPPFAVDEPESDSALAYLRRVRSEPPRPIRSSDATPELLTIIDRCLAKRREDRYPDATLLRDALRGVVTEARVWARTWRPQPLPGREAVVDPPPPGRAPVRHWTTEPPTPSTVTLAPLAAPDSPSRPDDADYRDERYHGRRSDGDRVDESEYDDDPHDGGRDHDVRGRTGWGRVLVLTVLALLLGTGIGVGGSWVLALRNRSPALTVPTFTGPVPSNAIPAQRNTALDPEITELNVVGTVIEIAWQDPTDGQAGFAIHHVTGGRDFFVQQIDPGTTRTVIADLEPDGGQYCFRVVAYSVIDSTQAGISDVACTRA